MIPRPKPRGGRGQALVEFALAAPLVFLVFLGTVQLAYLSYFYFAAQRASFAICRDAAASADPETFDPTFDLAAALLPMIKIHPELLLSILDSECRIQASGRQVRVSLRCPAPLWIPPFDRWFGRRLPPDAGGRASLQGLGGLLAPLGLPEGILSGVPIPSPAAVHWFNFQASALEEDGVTTPDPPEMP